MSKAFTPVSDRKTRLRQAPPVTKLSTEEKQTVQRERRNARIEALEGDFTGKAVVDEPTEYIPLCKRDREGDSGGKRRKQQPKKRRFVDRRLTNFAAVLEAEYYEAYPVHVPTYLSVAAAPSIYPPRHLCSVCGQVANYNCNTCVGARFCSPKCLATHKDTRCLKWG